MSTNASTTPPPEGIQLWTVRGLISGHRKAALVAACMCAVIVGVFVLVALGSTAGAVTDSTTCTQWGSANQNRQTTYGELYLKEHGAIPRWGGTPAAVINAINWGCGVAYGDDVADTATVVQAISGTF